MFPKCLGYEMGVCYRLFRGYAIVFDSIVTVPHIVKENLTIYPSAVSILCYIDYII